MLGRRKQVGPTLDPLFALPAAAVTLQVSAGFLPSGRAAVCYRESEGEPFDQVEAEITALVASSDPQYVADSYGYSWLLLRDQAVESATEESLADRGETLPDMGGLVTDMHTVTSTLQSSGFGPALLCDVMSFREAEGRRLLLVYLIKQGTFYPFAPVDDEKKERDTALELQVRALLWNELPMEPDLGRWFPLWSAPGMD